MVNPRRHRAVLAVALAAGALVLLAALVLAVRPPGGPVDRGESPATSPDAPEIAEGEEGSAAEEPPRRTVEVTVVVRASADDAPIPAATRRVASPEDAGPLYGVHVESFATAAEVTVAKRRYLAMGYPVTIDSVEEGRVTQHRVILGRFANKKEARRFTSGLAESLELNYMSIVRLEP